MWYASQSMIDMTMIMLWHYYGIIMVLIWYKYGVAMVYNCDWITSLKSVFFALVYKIITVILSDRNYGFGYGYNHGRYTIVKTILKFP